MCKRKNFKVKFFNQDLEKEALNKIHFKRDSHFKMSEKFTYLIIKKFI